MIHQFYLFFKPFCIIRFSLPPYSNFYSTIDSPFTVKNTLQGCWSVRLHLSCKDTRQLFLSYLCLFPSVQSDSFLSNIFLYEDIVRGNVIPYHNYWHFISILPGVRSGISLKKFKVDNVSRERIPVVFEKRPPVTFWSTVIRKVLQLMVFFTQSEWPKVKKDKRLKDLSWSNIREVPVWYRVSKNIEVWIVSQVVCSH